MREVKPCRVRTPHAAAHAGFSASYFEKLRVHGGGPPYYKVGRAVLYDLDDVDKWLAAQRRRSTSDRGTE